MIAAVYHKGTQPPEMEEAILCEMFNCLPSELDVQDAERMLQLITVNNIRYGKRKNGNQ